MPKMRMTEQQRREKNLALAISRARVDLDLPRDRDLSEYLGESAATHSYRKKAQYKLYGWEEAGNMARRLHFTAKEVCAILGVPYAQAAEE